MAREKNHRSDSGILMERLTYSRTEWYDVRYTGFCALMLLLIPRRSDQTYSCCCCFSLLLLLQHSKTDRTKKNKNKTTTKTTKNTRKTKNETITEQSTHDHHDTYISSLTSHRCCYTTACVPLKTQFGRKTVIKDSESSRRASKGKRRDARFCRRPLFPASVSTI